MNDDAMVFAMANPTPEVSPEEAAPYARIVATGRSDYPNQINNVLCFPGIFRGALDVRARAITEEMKMAAAAGHRPDHPRVRAARGLHRPLGLQPRRLARGGRRGGRAGQGAGRRDGRRRHHRLRGHRRRAACARASRGPSARRRRTPPMNVTLTGATGLIGARDRARAAGARRRRHGALARSRARARRPRRRRGPRLAAAARACPGRGAERARRGRAPGRRERGPALDRRRRGARSATRARSARATSSAGHRRRRARARASWSAPRPSATTARAATSRSPRTPPPATTSWPRCASRGSARRRAPPSTGCAWPAAHRRRRSTARAARWRRCCPSSAWASAAPSPAGASTCRGSTPTTSSGLYLAAARRRAWEGADQRHRARARRPTATSRAPSAARCTVPPSRPSPASPCACSTATWPRSSPPASAPCPARALERGFAFRHTDLEQALRDALGLTLGSRP